ncbi:MAG: inositol monophosphatase family protein [Ilumatobacteraceae bacterium]
MSGTGPDGTPPDGTAPDGTVLDDLLALAGELALRAGALVREGRRRGDLGADTKSSSTDVVTVYDRASEELIVGELRRHRPDDGLLGEEGAEQDGTTGVRWLIDPIDGTTNYLYDLAGYAVSIAAEDDEGGLVGAVYLPATDELFTAQRGGGARCNGATIRCSELTDVRTALVGTGFGYTPERRAAQGARAARLLPSIRDIRRFGAAAADLCYVAAGRLDGYYEQYLNPWDVAAGTLIAREAGAVVSTFAGSPGEPNGLLAAPPALCNALRTLVVDAG